jgi:hypothetical protein
MPSRTIGFISSQHHLREQGSKAELEHRAINLRAGLGSEKLRALRARPFSAGFHPAPGQDFAALDPLYIPTLNKDSSCSAGTSVLS